MTTFRYWMLRWFSKPSWDRSLYQVIALEKPKSILEIGLASVERTLNLVQIAQRASPDIEFKYCGIDLFDARSPGGQPVKLKDAHCQLHKTKAKVRLMPGEFHDCLPRYANQVGKHDLVIITTMEDALIFAPAWYFVPRMLETSGLVLLRDLSRKEQPYKILSPEKVARLAAEQEPGQRKAA
ncbi:MAG: hypothetical protein ABL888_07590 [Pirellulaceae bacterium]